TSAWVYIRPGSAQPSDASGQVTDSARGMTTALFATRNRFAASATTARRTAFGIDATGTGLPSGPGAFAMTSGMRVGGATPVFSCAVAQAANTTQTIVDR